MKISGQYVRIVVAVCLLMSAMIACTVGFGFFMEPVTTNLGYDRSAFAIYFSLTTLVGAASLPVYGRLIGRFGARPFSIFCCLWSALCLAAFSFCTSLPSFYVVGALLGLGFYGGTYSAVPVVVNTWFPGKSGTVMGIASTVGGLATVVMSLVFPSLIAAIGWRTGYLAFGAVMFILGVPSSVFLLRSRPSDLGLEPLGAADAAAGEGQPGEVPGMTFGNAMKSPQMWLLVLALILFAGVSMVTQHLVAHFVGIGFSPALAGAMLSVASVGIVVTSPIIGGSVDKLGLKKTLVIFSLIAAATYAVLPFAVALVACGVVMFLISVVNMYASILAPVMTGSIFGPRDYASIWGVVSVACVVGQAIGAPVWGLSYDLTGSYNAGMFIAAVIVLVGIALSLAAMGIKRKNG